MDRPKIKVLVVEDSPAMQQLLVHLLQGDPGIEVVGVAADGFAALEMLSQKRPDIVTVDAVMPRMDGFEVTRRIMELYPLPVVIVSASWQPREVATTFSAVEAGAVAVVGKPRGPGFPGHAHEAREFLATIKAMSEVKVVRRWARVRQPGPGAAPTSDAAAGPAPATPNPVLRLIAIGASTGGPLVVQTILAGLPKDLPVPVLIVQHIAEGFLPGMADWLQRSTGFPTQIAKMGEVPLPGRAYLAPDGFHMTIRPDGRIGLDDTDGGEISRPSVARLFASVVEAYASHAAGVLLSGMGKDGAEELGLMRRRGALTIAQDRASSVVFGMPGEAVRIGAAAHVLSPDRIAALLVSAARGAAESTSQKLRT